MARTNPDGRTHTRTHIPYKNCNNYVSLYRFVDMDVVNDVTCTRQSVITRVVIQFYDMTLSAEQRRHMIKRNRGYIEFATPSIQRYCDAKTLK